ncbi:MAG TPA: hypothetical protein VER77_00995 [Candidatus Dormibacteraeota bacterium]|nr:hypothetical protein [Candidatus Dormibacteraeota bacterium]
MSTGSILINRAAVLTLWAAVVAERLGYDRDTALTLGRAVAGLNAQSKGRRLGIYAEPSPEIAAHRAPSKPGPKTVFLLGRGVPVTRTPEGLRAVVKGRVENPDSVKRYLKEKFGESLPQAQAAMRALAKAYPPERLAEIGFSLYEEFRPEIPSGTKGWGAKGRFDPNRIRALARSA